MIRGVWGDVSDVFACHGLNIRAQSPGPLPYVQIDPSPIHASAPDEHDSLPSPEESPP